MVICGLNRPGIPAKSVVIDQVPTVFIDHNAVCQLRIPRQSVESLFRPSAGIKAGIKKILESMHNKNKSILKEVLLPEILERIGLGS